MIGEGCVQFIKTFPEDKMTPKKCQGKYIPLHDSKRFSPREIKK